ncbi:MAG TPA: GNVR domain-containing protein [Candidatus Angelobacter sp.]
MRSPDEEMLTTIDRHSVAEVEAPPGQSELLSPPGEKPTLFKLRLLWESRQFLMKAAGIGLCLSLLSAFLLPKQYESTTRVMPPEPDTAGAGIGSAISAVMGGGGGGGGGSAIGSALGGTAADLLGIKGSGPPYPAILGSRTVQDRLVDRFDLMHLYKTRYRINARKQLASKTNISEDRKTGIVSITVTDRDPRRAAAMARAYIDELSRLVGELGTSSARRERVFLEARLKEVKQDLDQAAKEFSEFSSKNATLDISDEGKAMVEGAAVLQGELIAAQSELQGLEQIYTSNNVRVRSLQARIEELKRQLARLGGTNSNPSSQVSPTDLYPSIRQLPLLGVRYAELYHRTKTQEIVYTLLTQQYEMAKVQEAKETATVKVLDDAEVPEKKSFPPRLLLGILGAIMSVLLASAWSLAKWRWDMISPLDARKAFAHEIFETLKASCLHLWGSRRDLPKEVVNGALRWFRPSNDRGGNGQ